MNTICKNCASSFEGKFCNHCGQAADTPEINFKSVVQEIQHTVLQIDKGLLYTSRELLFRPGNTIRSYLEGKRVQHVKPFAYIFILSTLYILLTNISHKSTFLSDFFEGFYNGSNDNQSKNELGLIGEMMNWMANHYAYATLIIIPLVSLASYFCFFKAGYNYFQHLVINSYMAGQRTVVYLLILPLTYFITDEGINDIIDGTKAFLGIGLTFWAYFQFFQTFRGIHRILLTLASYLMMLTIIILLMFFILLIQNLWK